MAHASYSGSARAKARTLSQRPSYVPQVAKWSAPIREGAPVDGARFTIGGGMPQHGHGLPTRPAVTANPGDGRYLIEGVKFNMPGWWELDLGIDAPQGADVVTFNLVL